MFLREVRTMPATMEQTKIDQLPTVTFDQDGSVINATVIISPGDLPGTYHHEVSAISAGVGASRFGFGQREIPSEGSSICWNLGVSQAMQVEICPSSGFSAAAGAEIPRTTGSEQSSTVRWA
jgi:hypothetical protein